MGGYEGEGCGWFLRGGLAGVFVQRRMGNEEGTRTATFRSLRSARIWAIWSRGGRSVVAICEDVWSLGWRCWAGLRYRESFGPWRYRRRRQCVGVQKLLPRGPLVLPHCEWGFGDSIDLP